MSIASFKLVFVKTELFVQVTLCFSKNVTNSFEVFFACILYLSCILFCSNVQQFQKKIEELYLRVQEFTVNYKERL
jgi:hypothetical protein